jgi:hypothetical protein
MNGHELIAQERQRQVEKEGWSPDHDDNHDSCELATAAAFYALPSNWRERCQGDPWKWLWPWDSEEFKPGPDRISELTKSGALIAAEIDRLQRLQ